MGLLALMDDLSESIEPVGDGSQLVSQGNQQVGEIGSDRVSEGFNRPLQELDRSN